MSVVFKVLESVDVRSAAKWGGRGSGSSQSSEQRLDGTTHSTIFVEDSEVAVAVTRLSVHEPPERRVPTTYLTLLIRDLWGLRS